MTDLQLGLLVIGGLVVVGVFAYNRRQERAARLQAQRAFGGSRHADVLLQEPQGRREPTFHARGESMPDERVDYIVELKLVRALACASVLEPWRPVEQRFAGRAALSGSDGNGWRKISAGDPGHCTDLRAALQLVTRAGAVSEAELVEFRSAVETLAARIGAAVSAPEMRRALETARELDRSCADCDVQIALHVLGVPTAQDLGEQPFQVTLREEGLTLTLDVARTAEPGRAFEAMARTARQLGGRLVDDNGNAVDERALAAIGAQLEAVRQTLADRGIEPGSALALRLFS